MCVWINFLLALTSGSHPVLPAAHWEMIKDNGSCVGKIPQVADAGQGQVLKNIINSTAFSRTVSAYWWGVSIVRGSNKSTRWKSIRFATSDVWKEIYTQRIYPRYFELKAGIFGEFCVQLPYGFPIGIWRGIWMWCLTISHNVSAFFPTSDLRWWPCLKYFSGHTTNFPLPLSMHFSAWPNGWFLFIRLAPIFAFDKRVVDSFFKGLGLSPCAWLNMAGSSNEGTFSYAYSPHWKR